MEEVNQISSKTMSFQKIFLSSWTLECAQRNVCIIRNIMLHRSKDDISNVGQNKAY